ncbi:MAG TPA: glycine cleavage system protein GcvH [Thermoanaerobaculia bacterium]|nr:glycine cleavage system protein GcvH [Thermoanaerobaculia bacterium]
MTTINGCNIPEDLYYLTEKHVWARPEGEGLLVIGMSDVAQHLAGNILTLTAKKVGRNVPKGQSVATIESAKWVGPVPAPVGGEIVDVNEAVRKNPKLLNSDPYGEGWIVRIKPTDWEGEKAALASGPTGIETYRAFLDSQGIKCD